MTDFVPLKERLRELEKEICRLEDKLVSLPNRAGVWKERADYVNVQKLLHKKQGERELLKSILEELEDKRKKICKRHHNRALKYSRTNPECTIECSHNDWLECNAIMEIIGRGEE